MKVAELMDRVVKLGLDIDSYINDEARSDEGDMLMYKVAEAFNRSMPKVHVGFNTRLDVTPEDDYIVFKITGVKKDA